MKAITSAFTCLACKACTDRQVCVRQDFACEVQQDFVPQVQARPPIQVAMWGSYSILGP